jgi:DNA-binding CsgD family transcriptional regulator/tetratricopeptide (TPR) repeat protein
MVASVRGVAGPVSSPLFIGREPELAVLEVAVSRAAEGAGSAALVAGESGIGKSRLIAELRVRAEGAGATVLIGECLELAEGDLPYAALIGALRNVVRGLDAEEVEAILGPGLAQLAPLLPELAAISGKADTAPGDGDQGRLFEALLGALTRLGEAAPVVLVIEDLHWADRSTRDFLSFLVRNAREERLVLIATYRSDELHRRHPLRPFVLELERSGQAERVDLRPFDRDELAGQLEAIVGSAPDPVTLERLLERSDGNPFFAEELLAATSAGAALPDSLRDVLLLRVEALAPATRSLLRIAAVAGRRIDHALLEDLGQLSSKELNERLREAIAGYVLVADHEGRGYSFRHALLREAVYEDLLPGERRDLHIALAEALAAAPDLARSRAGAAAELAFHWYAAHELGPALGASVEAGVEAERVGALGEASTHLRRALEIWDAGVEAGAAPALDRIEVTRRAAEMENYAGDTGQAARLARLVIASIDAGADPTGAAIAHERLGRYLWTDGRGEQALVEYARAVEMMPAEPPSEERAQVLAGYGQVLMLAGRITDSLPHCEAALEIARDLGAGMIEAQALNTVAVSYAYQGEAMRAVESCAQARRLALAVGSLTEIGRSYVNGADSLDEAGRSEEAIALTWEGVGLMGELGGDRLYGDFMRAENAMRLVATGSWDEAEELLAEIGGRRPSGIIAGQVELQHAHLLACRGELAVAVPAAARARELVVDSGGVMWMAPLHVLEATIDLLDGDPGAAATRIDAGIALVDGDENPYFTAGLYELGACAAAELASEAREDRGREEQVSRIENLVARLGGVIEAQGGTPSPEAVGCLLVCEAELPRARGESDPVLWGEARSFWEGHGDPFRAAQAGLRETEATLAIGGDRRAAAEVLREARGIAAALGAAPLQEEIEALARRSRLKIGAAGSASGSEGQAERLELTPRELEVIGQLALGQTNREIAGTLFISEKTAGVHVSHILAKCDVRNRAEAAALAQRLGLAAEPDGSAGAGALQ